MAEKKDRKADVFAGEGLLDKLKRMRKAAEEGTVEGLQKRGDIGQEKMGKKKKKNMGKY